MIAQLGILPGDESELDRLNAAVDAALEARTKWLDAKMASVSRFKIGDEVYNLKTGRRYGTVVEHYRLHRGDIFDRSLCCDVRISDGNNSSGSLCCERLGTKEDLIQERQWELERLKP